MGKDVHSLLCCVYYDENIQEILLCEEMRTIYYCSCKFAPKVVDFYVLLSFLWGCDLNKGIEFYFILVLHELKHIAYVGVTQFFKVSKCVTRKY